MSFMENNSDKLSLSTRSYDRLSLSSRSYDNNKLSFSTRRSWSSSSNKTHRRPPRRHPPSTSEAEATCLAKLNEAVKEDPSLQQHPHVINSIMIYRFAAFHSFDYETALAALKQNCNQRFLHLSLSDDHDPSSRQLLTQIQTEALFPLPGLKTRDLKCSVVYMRPSRYSPVDHTGARRRRSSFPRRRSSLVGNNSRNNKNNDNDDNNDDNNMLHHHPIIDSLCYVLNDMSQTKEDCKNGVAFIANMEDWTMQHFSHDYCMEFMQALQGKMVPTKVELFLIVNPPKWFGKIYKIMKPMLSKSFFKRTHMIKDTQLGDFLMDGYERYLPDEFQMGLARSEEILEDFVDLKRYEDEQKQKQKQKQKRQEQTLGI